MVASPLSSFPFLWFCLRSVAVLQILRVGEAFGDLFVSVRSLFFRIGRNLSEFGRRFSFVGGFFVSVSVVKLI